MALCRKKLLLSPIFLETETAVDKVSKAADRLIKDYAFGSSLTGFIPIPWIDLLGLISVQRIMLVRLAKLYEIPFSKHLSKVWLTTLMGGIASNAASPVVGSALKMIPVIGTLVGGASMAAMGGASTYAIGKVFQQHFEQGGTLEDFDPEQAKKALNEELEAGKKILRNKKK